MLHRILRILLWIAVSALVLVTLLPFTNSNEWWIRMWDFPRIHILVTATTLAVATGLLLGRAFLPVAILLAVAAVHAHRIFPFTPLAATEIEFTEAQNGPAVTLLAANVLMDNRDYRHVIDLIANQRPDILLLMETDAEWLRALEPSLSDYATVLSHPQSNYYGMIFATRLAADSAKVIFLADEDTPSVLAELQEPEGRRFTFLGLHPRPPVPGHDTDERDAQIRRAAELALRPGRPAVLMGDFNDVAWSWTADRYKHHGGFLDPRVGRGILPSFDANHPILRFPIDQLYVTDGVELVGFERGPHVGSDHFPLQATIRIADRNTDSR